jgi:two-component system response regulator HydG
LSIAVVQLSSSFDGTLADLVVDAGAAGLVKSGSVADPAFGTCHAGIVAAGGVENGAAETVRAWSATSSIPLVVVGAEPDHHVATALVRAGAQEYFALPGDLPMLRGWLEERIERADERARRDELGRSEADHYDFDAIVGRSDELHRALRRVSKVIPRAGVTVLITGETGTGKELVARALHFNGERRVGPFVEVNCAALPATLLEAELFGYEKGAFTDARTAKPGLFEAADGGTLFLDEIGDLPLDLQVKLLKVLEDRRVRRLGSVESRDVEFRLVAATHVNLSEAVREGRFRQDLFYRLNVIPVHLPALRERGDDVLLLARHFAAATADRHGLPVPEIRPDVTARLRAYDWPGNVRELRNAIERAVLLGDGTIDVGDLDLEEVRADPGTSSPLPFPAPLAEIERAAALAALERMEGNKSAAAELLSISRTRLYRLLEDA